MQNTNVNPVSQNTSTLSESRSPTVEHHVCVARLPKLTSTAKRPLGFLQRIKSFCAVLFFSKRESFSPKRGDALEHTVEKAVSYSQKALQPEVNMQPGHTHQHQALLRALAERQFMEMDITRATRN